MRLAATSRAGARGRRAGAAGSGEPARLHRLERSPLRVEAWRAVGNRHRLGRRPASKASLEIPSRATTSRASCWRFAPSAREDSSKTRGRWRSAPIRGLRRRLPSNAPGTVTLENNANGTDRPRRRLCRHCGSEVRHVDGHGRKWQTVAPFRARTALAAVERRQLRRHADVGHGEGRGYLQRLLPRLEGHVGHGQRNGRWRGGARGRRIYRGEGRLHADVRQGRRRDACIMRSP